MDLYLRASEKKISKSSEENEIIKKFEILASILRKGDVYGMYNFLNSTLTIIAFF